MKLRQTNRRERGIMLIECLVYGVVLLILLGVAYTAFIRCIENSAMLRRNTDDIVQAIKAGERWRADIRAASGAIRVEHANEAEIIRVPTEDGEVTYQFSTNAILRRVADRPWNRILPNVTSSVMSSDTRGQVTAWRWELELKPRSKKSVRMRPLFTFLAVPESKSAK